MIKLKQSFYKSASLLWHSLYAQTITLALLAVAAILFMLLADRSLGRDLTANLPAEAIGVAISALVTVFIVQRAFETSEKKRWAPALRSTLLRMLADCDYCISYLALKAKPKGVELPKGARNIAPWLTRMLESKDAFFRTDRAGRRLMIDDLQRRDEYIQDAAFRAQVVIAREPSLFHQLLELHRSVLYWLGVHATPDLTDDPPQGLDETEVEAMRDVARKFISLRSEIQRVIPPDEIEQDT